MSRLTLICPETLIEDANALASALGVGPDDGQSFGNPVWIDENGARFAVMSLVSATLSDTLAAPLVAPTWPVDLQAAERARTRISRISAADGPGDPTALRLFAGISAIEALARARLQADAQGSG